MQKKLRESVNLELNTGFVMWESDSSILLQATDSFFAKGQFWWDPESARLPRCHDLGVLKSKELPSIQVIFDRLRLYCELCLCL